MNSGETVRFRTYDNEMAAQTAAAHLASCGIDAFVKADSTGTDPRAHLFVNESDETEVEQILGAIDEEQVQDDPLPRLPAESDHGRIILALLIGIPIFIVVIFLHTVVVIVVILFYQENQ